MRFALPGSCRFSVVEHRVRIEAALRPLHRFIDELLERRRGAPQDDLLSALIAAEEAGELLTDAELRWMVLTLMSTGHGTAQHQLGNAMAAFMAHPPQWRQLAAEPGARGELQEALPLLARRLREPTPAGASEWLPPTEAVYGPLRLPIRYQPA